MGQKQLTREQIINRIIGFDFLEWYERLLDIKAVIDLPKPKNGVYHQGPVTKPKPASIFETGTVGFAPTDEPRRKYRHRFDSVSTESEFGDTNEWNKRSKAKKLGKG
jgi:hypothetical protein